MQKLLRIPVLSAVWLGCVPPLSGGTPDTAFHGTQAVLKHYRVAYQLNSGDPKHIGAVLRNIANALSDPRLDGKLEVELVAHGGGVAVFKKDSGFEPTLKTLQQRGVVLAQCENTLRERGISKEALFDFISYVPSGNGELIILQQQGWALMHP